MNRPQRRSWGFGIALALFSVIAFLTAGSIAGVIVSSGGILLFAWAVSRKRGRSLVGEKCPACGDPITLEYQAEICPYCDCGIHARCLANHSHPSV